MRDSLLTNLIYQIMKKKHALMMMILPFLIIGTISSCKKETIVKNEIYQPSEITITAKEQDLTEKGWKLFTQKKFTEALEMFQEATEVNSLYTDAYNGLGWAYSQLDSLEKSHHNFSICIVSTTNDQIHKDACAGRAFVNLAMSEYEKAIMDVDEVIFVPDNYSDYYTDYAFRHEPTFSKNKLLLVKAESYFMLGIYNYCLYTLWHIDESIEDNTDPEVLAIIIEELKHEF
jgi:tetratricopeptide (TPR) repeat protein